MRIYSYFKDLNFLQLWLVYKNYFTFLTLNNKKIYTNLKVSIFNVMQEEKLFMKTIAQSTRYSWNNK